MCFGAGYEYSLQFDDDHIDPNTGSIQIFKISFEYVVPFEIKKE